MRKLVLDQFTKDQAIEYANLEAELHGYKVGSDQWKKTFKHYLSFAVGTMSVGRNPRRNPRDDNAWPEIFGGDGFAARVAHNFKGKRGEKPSQREISERVKGSITTLVYLYLNGVYGVKTTTEVHESGRIKASEMSDLQLRGSDESMSSEEAHAENLDVIYNQLAMTIIETAAYEFLIPFFTMPKEDVQAILDKISVEGKASSKDMAKYRTETEKRIREAVGLKLKDLSFKKLVLG